ARFVTLASDPGMRWFRTGDIVRVVAGSLVFRGRRDQQVKVRGYRVELGEIENALVACADVREAAAVMVGDDLANLARMAAVPAPGEMAAEARSPLEKTLIGLLRDILRVEAVGIHDDFFAIGG